MKIALGIFLFAMAQVVIWFQLNSQFVWEWWKDKPLLSVGLFAIPSSLLLWYATSVTVAETKELWAARLIAFGASYLTFPLMTWVFAGESMFTTKTMICTFLAFTIVGVQILWR